MNNYQNLLSKRIPSSEGVQIVRQCVWAVILAVGVCLQGLAAETVPWAEVRAVFPKGASCAPVVRRVPLVPQGAGGWRFELKRDEFPKGAERVEVRTSLMEAHRGEDGFWVLPDGRYGTFRLDEGACLGMHRRSSLPIFGMKTPRGACLGIVRGMRLAADLSLAAEKGTYRLWTTFRLAEAGGVPYEDASIDFLPLAAGEDTYAGMARRYRADRLARGEVRPLSARVKGNDVLKYTTESIFVRVKHGYKCLNTEKKVEHQSPTNEPPVQCVISFADFKDILRRMKAVGVAKAEVCSVGGTAGGFDGRFPDVLPIPEEFGGEREYREAITLGRELGYQMTVHFCVTAMFECSRQWNPEAICRRADGQMMLGGVVAGGRTHRLCPRVFLRDFMKRDWTVFRDLGFRGTHHIDVVSCIPPYACFHPDHPLDFAASARCFREMADYSRSVFGGFGSESGFDWMAPSLDFALYTSWYPGCGGAEFSPLVDRVVPLWQLVYHGIIVSNPFYATIDGYIDRAKEGKDYSDDAARFGYLKDAETRILKIHEFGGRPVFYYTLYKDVMPLKRASDDYAKFAHLQYEFMEDHRELARDVFLTRYGNGAETVVNYSSEPFAWKDRTVAPRVIELFPSK